ncbi:hypothetical protein STRAU_2975 [Streptomyces aurantiacus JA 4570]|uniref:Uncharacterized protein n=1 Tax=Streptomyces aurantiacus JA 4570 TaxID=1286094 RepID=S4ARB0_9ACTN|nr:hypothetical protein STRAU_2975 [Streptomyces aurantiacus JA 4570]
MLSPPARRPRPVGPRGERQSVRANLITSACFRLP